MAGTSHAGKSWAREVQLAILFSVTTCFLLLFLYSCNSEIVPVFFTLWLWLIFEPIRQLHCVKLHLSFLYINMGGSMMIPSDVLYSLRILMYDAVNFLTNV
jgi:hypothetical protein